ncbi:MAG: pyruvate kinase [Lachnospiraceae bacterium]|nr:pyruvate kinase [Lachnospiraceae bacterium]
MRRTKIVCTLGPSANTEEAIKSLALAGMNVARLNFSHGDFEEHGGRFERLKKIRKELALPIAALLDTKGPEIRIGTFYNDDHKRVDIEEGQTFTLTGRDVEGTNEIVSLTYKELAHDIKPGGKILLDDGLIELEVKKIDDLDIICKAINGGNIGGKRGVNVPNLHINMPFVSEKDYADIVFAVEQGFDFIAASFTRTAEDVLQVRKIIADQKKGHVSIIAKIENQEGVNNIDDILKVADGVMVARGDMGVEIPLEEVPVIQKMIIEKANKVGKPVITATQMLDSMMKNPRPTRAEATDVANAIYQGTSAVMLSGETANGKYPAEAVKTMARIAERTEADIDYVKALRANKACEGDLDITEAISHATCTTAADLEAKAIITVTKSGDTARMISKYHPDSLIAGCSPNEKVCRQLNLSWGVTPICIAEESNLDALIDASVEAAKYTGLVESGDTVVMTAGQPGVVGKTNLIKAAVVD